MWGNLRTVINTKPLFLDSISLDDPDCLTGLKNIKYTLWDIYFFRPQKNPPIGTITSPYISPFRKAPTFSSMILPNFPRWPITTKSLGYWSVDAPVRFRADPVATWWGGGQAKKTQGFTLEMLKLKRDSVVFQQKKSAESLSDDMYIVKNLRRNAGLCT